MSGLYDVRLMPFRKDLIFFKKGHFYCIKCLTKTEVDLTELCAELGHDAWTRDFNRS